MTATTATAPSAATIEAIKQRAKRLSILSMMSTTAAGFGHPTSCMSAAELVAGTFFYAMKFPELRLMTLREFSSELEGHPRPRIPGVDAFGISARHIVEAVRAIS